MRNRLGRPRRQGACLMLSSAARRRPGARGEGPRPAEWDRRASPIGPSSPPRGSAAEADVTRCCSRRSFRPARSRLRAAAGARSACRASLRENAVRRAVARTDSGGRPAGADRAAPRGSDRAVRGDPTHSRGAAEFEDRERFYRSSRLPPGSGGIRLARERFDTFVSRSHPLALKHRAAQQGEAAVK